MFRTRMLLLPARKQQRDLFIITKDIFFSIYWLSRKLLQEIINSVIHAGSK